MKVCRFCLHRQHLPFSHGGGGIRRYTGNAGPVGHILIDSAGTHDYHIGEPSDSRTHRAALQRGHDMGGLRGRQVEEGDVRRFDYALAMGKANLAILQRLAPPTGDAQMRLFLEYAAEGLLQDIG